MRVFFAIEADGEGDRYVLPGVSVWTRVQDYRHSNQYLILVPHVSGYFGQYLPGYPPTRYRANNMTGRFPPASAYGGGYSPTIRGIVEFETFPGLYDAEASIVWPTVIDAAPSSSIGPTTVAQGFSSTWRAYPNWDTASYWYQWVKDGQSVLGATAASYSTSFNTTGPHSLKVIVFRADSVHADTVSINVAVTPPPIIVSILGEAAVRPNVPDCFFGSTVTGGNGDYSYVWRKNGQVVGSNSPTLAVSTGASDFSLSLTVSETGFTTGYSERTISVSSGAPEWACNEQ